MSIPVFPQHSIGENGMMLRDWFAGQALAGLIASPAFRPEDGTDTAARACYVLADAMLAERAKG